MTFIHHFNTAATHAAGLAWAIVWQSTLLALVIALVCVALRRSSPAVRYWLWQIVALKLLLMPFWTLAVPLPESLAPWFSPPATSPIDTTPMADGHEFVSIAPDESERTAGETTSLSPADPALILASPVVNEPREALCPTASFADIHWPAWLLMAWGVVVLWQFARLLRQGRGLSRLLKTAGPLADARLVDLLERAAQQLELRHRPEVVLVETDGSPFVCGVRRPVLVLPRSLLATLDDTQLRQILLHELAHIQRHDLLWGWVPEIARTIYFFHPVAHWVASRIRLERELACDQAAITLTTRNPAEYAQTLVQVVTHASRPVHLRAAAGTVGLDGGNALRGDARSESAP
jgi:beta-lactamase regulating signal transducer with metallopeptidase domain